MIYAPTISLMLMVFGSAFFMSFLSLYFKRLDVSEMTLGVTQSSFYLGLLVGSLKTEKLISRIGHIRVIAASCGILAGSTLILFFVQPEYWLGFRILAGACVGAFYVGIESWLLAEYPAHRRGQALAIYTISLYLSQSLSQTCLSLSDKNPAIAFIFSAFFITLAVAPVSLSFRKGPDVTMVEPEKFSKFIKLSPLGFAGCFFSGIMLSSLYAFMPVYAKEQGFSPSFMMTIMVLGGTLLQWPVGKISDLFERRKILTIVALVAILPFLMLGFTSSQVFFAVSVFFAGGMCFTIYPIAMALGCDCVETKDMVKMTGVLLFAYGCGSVIGPILTPSIQFASDHYLIIMMTIYSALVVIVGVYSQYTRKPITIEEQSDFSVVPRGPVPNELNPNLQ